MGKSDDKSRTCTITSKKLYQLEVFRPVIANNLTIKSALDAGMMKEVSISSSEVDGITWTVNGIIADRRGIAVLYTIQNNTDQKMRLLACL